MKTELKIVKELIQNKEPRTIREIAKKSEFFSQIFKEGNYIYGEI